VLVHVTWDGRVWSTVGRQNALRAEVERRGAMMVQVAVIVTWTVMVVVAVAA